MKNNDSPIRWVEDDALNRDDYAQLIAQELGKLDVSDGVVAAITGPWGAGKTSFFNLIKAHLPSDITTWEFNPWFFSHSEDLLSRFLIEFGRKLSTGDATQLRAARELRKLSRALQPLDAIPFIGGSTRSIREATSAAADLFDPARDVHELRDRLGNILAGHDQRYLVFIDDVDRLEPAEIRSILKLVRLVASLPNVIYVLAYDQTRVVEAISADTNFGEEFLEKIVFASYRLPSTNIVQIRDYFVRGLNNLLADVNPARDWGKDLDPITISDIILPGLTTLRKVKRFLSSVTPSVISLSEIVHLSDLLTMEKIRIFRPDVLNTIQQKERTLTWNPDRELESSTSKEQIATDVADILAMVKSQWVDLAVRNLFDHSVRYYLHANDDTVVHTSGLGESLLGRRRIQHSEIFQAYFDRFVDENSRQSQVQLLDSFSKLPFDYNQVMAFFNSLDSSAFDLLAEGLLRRVNETRLSMRAVLVKALCEYAAETFRAPKLTSQLNGTAFKLATRYIQNMPRGSTYDQSWYLERYSELRTIGAKFLFVRALATDNSRRLSINKGDWRKVLLAKYQNDFISASEQDLERELRLLFMLVDLYSKTGTSPDLIFSLVARPPVAWALIRSSVSVAPNIQGVILDTENLRLVLGGQERLEEIVQVCARNPTGAQSDDHLLVVILEKLHISKPLHQSVG